jgi:hypothetical protein
LGNKTIVNWANETIVHWATKPSYIGQRNHRHLPKETIVIYGVAANGQ